MLNIIVSPVFAIFGFMLKTWCACVCVVATMNVWFYVTVFVFL